MCAETKAYEDKFGKALEKRAEDVIQNIITTIPKPLVANISISWTEMLLAYFLLQAQEAQIYAEQQRKLSLVKEQQLARQEFAAV